LKPKNITFGDMHPEASTNEEQKSCQGRLTDTQGGIISEQWTEEDNLPQKI
jgi:hypothetical protein